MPVGLNSIRVPCGTVISVLPMIDTKNGYFQISVVIQWNTIQGKYSSVALQHLFDYFIYSNRAHDFSCIKKTYRIF